MSGGSFDYVHLRVEAFAETLGNALSADEKSGQSFSPATIAKLRQIQSQSAVMSKLMREVDYLYSADTGDDTFLQRVADIEAGLA